MRHKSFFSKAEHEGLYGQAQIGYRPEEMELKRNTSGLEKILSEMYAQFKDVVWLRRTMALTNVKDAKQNQKDIQKNIWACSWEASKAKKEISASVNEEPVALLTFCFNDLEDVPEVIEVQGPLKFRSRVVLWIP